MTFYLFRFRTIFFGQLDRGSDLEAKDAEGNTPLLVAAANGQDATIRLLLKSGANITALNRNDHSAIHLAAKRTNCTSLQVPNV